MKKIIPMLLASSVVGLSGCGGGTTETTTGGGGSSGGTVAGLDMPVTLSVVTAKETTMSGRQVAALNVNYAAVIAALTDLSSDYTTDPQNKWVHDRALEPLDEVNNILCYIGQTGAEKLVNKTYIALIDAASCERSGGGGGGQNQSSGGGKTVQMEKWTVQSTRADNSSPQIVRIWAPSGGDGGSNRPPTEIRAEITITEGVTSANPFGKFVLNFQGVTTSAWTSPMGGFTVPAGTAAEKGTLKTVATSDGKIGFTMYQESMDGGKRQVSVVAATDQSSGVAFTGGKEFQFDKTANGGAGANVAVEKAFAVAFDASHVLVKRDVTPVSNLSLISNETEGADSTNPAACLDRTKFNRNVWRYNLYNVGTGARLALNSGFPFRWDSNSDGSIDSFGYVSYWGVWSEKTPPGGWNGTSITKESFGSTAAPQTYTVTETAGKLIRRDKATILLTDLDGQTFNYSKCDMNGCSGQFIVEYDNNGSVTSKDVNGNDTTVAVSGGGFYETLQRTWNPNSPPTDTALQNGPVLIVTDPSVQGSSPFLGMYSEGLGGPVNYNGGDPMQNDHVTFYKETFITGADTGFDANGQIKLDCYTRCLMPNINDSQYVDMSWPSTAYYPDAQSVATPAAQYAFDKNTLALTVAAVGGNTSHADVGKVVKLATGVPSTQQGQSQWGIASDSMVVGGATMSKVYDSWNQPTTYRWETGHNSWNKMIGVKESASSVAVSFDKPISFSYKHLTANDANGDPKFNNKTFLLNYGGSGDLWGIPWVDASGNSGNPGPNSEMRPAFALKDGILMGPTGTEYAVKGIDMELNPKSATGLCGSLALNQPAEPLPTAVTGTPSNTTGVAPTPDSQAPAAIGGIVQ